MKNQSVATSYRPYLALTLAIFLGLLVACSDTSNNGLSGSGNQEEGIKLLELLPASTRGFFQVSHTAVKSDQQWSDMLENVVTPWRYSPLHILRYYSGDLEVVGNAEQFMLAQATVTGAEHILLADIDASIGDSLLDDAATESAGEYQGFPIWVTSSNGLSLVRLNARTWVVAPQASLETVIDVHLGIRPGIEESAIADQLDSLDDSVSVNIIYGLPALYGEVPLPGAGDSSLNPASVLTASLDIEQGIVNGGMQFIVANAAVYTERLLGLLPADSPDIISAAGDTISIDLTDMAAPEDLLPLLKSLYIGMNAVDYAEAVTQGGNPPWLNFNVGENPNSVFINFEFTDLASREAFELDHLPAGFKLAPLRILETDTPRYFLVLNIYQSSGGLVDGARAEWSVFTHDPETSEPRFLVVQAAAENITVDSVNLVVLPEPVFHRQEPAAIASFVGVDNEVTAMVDTYFSSVINWPQPPETHVNFNREFVAANDYIFWGNAVADRGLYNASVHNRPAVRIPENEIRFVDNSPWANYIKPEPVHTLVYLNPLDIVVSPWWNLDEDYLDVTEAYRQELIDFKNNFYPGMMLEIAEAGMLGVADPLRATMTGEAVATAYYHFIIEDPEALLASVGAQGAFIPVAISLDGVSMPDMYLTLEVAESPDDLCGLRATWSMYVLNEHNRPQALQLDSFGSDACLDPVSLLGLSGVVRQQIDAGALTTLIESPFIRFNATLNLNSTTKVSPGQDWVESWDQVCSLNGVCNFTYYDGQTLVQPLDQIAFGGSSITEIYTPWNEFINLEPAAITVRQLPAIRAANIWKNVPVFGQ